MLPDRIPFEAPRINEHYFQSINDGTPVYLNPKREAREALKRAQKYIFPIFSAGSRRLTKFPPTGRRLVQKSDWVTGAKGRVRHYINKRAMERYYY